MPLAMSLSGSKTSSETLRIPDNVFAIHALACIKLHDDPRNGTYNRNLRYLAKVDPHLRYADNTLLLDYLLTFGRHSEPLLKRTLLQRFNYTEELIAKQVDAIAAGLAPVVFTGE